MLSKSDNELLTRIGPDAPMGDVFRRCWLPALMSSEIEPDGAPRRVRLLGESLVAFRDSEGRPGLLDEACPHRGASLVLGRNEECGLRCLYHGWKVTTDGTLVDTPTEPAFSRMKQNVSQPSYPVREAGGFVWAYLGDSERIPEFPDFEWNLVPEEHRLLRKVWMDCNWLQAFEGGMDPAHLSWLHQDQFVPSAEVLTLGRGELEESAERTPWPTDDGAPRLEISDTPYGFCCHSIRKVIGVEEYCYVRSDIYVMPCFVFVPRPRGLGSMGIFVPADDERTWFYMVHWVMPDFTGDPEVMDQWSRTLDRRRRRNVETSGEFRSVRNRENNWLQDRESMRNGRWSGFPSVGDEDIAVTESQGPIVDRSREHLGATDLAIIWYRKLMLELCREVKAGGAPAVLDAQGYYGRIRAEERVISADEPWESVGGLLAPSD